LCISFQRGRTGKEGVFLRRAKRIGDETHQEVERGAVRTLNIGGPGKPLTEKTNSLGTGREICIAFECVGKAIRGAKLPDMGEVANPGSYKSSGQSVYWSKKSPKKRENTKQ